MAKPAESKEAAGRFSALPHFKPEYEQTLVDLGVKDRETLTRWLADEEKSAALHRHLKGVGPKTLEAWRAALGAAKAEAAPPAAVEEAKPSEEAEPSAPPARKAARKVRAPKKEREAKPPREPAEAEEAAAAGAEEEEAKPSVEVVEPGKHEAKLKATLTPALARALSLRAQKRRRNPKFRRQDYWIRQRLQATGWRRPRGLHSKMRQHYAYRQNVVSIGFRTPKAARHLHPSGFEEVLVSSARELEGLDPKRQAVRIAHGVGMRKRQALEARADELGLRVLNRTR